MTEATPIQTPPNFEKLETISSGYFTYILGHFRQPDIYVLGAMDLDDPASWSGGETSTVFYFMITPEEYSWRTSNRPLLDTLAQRIQTNMPRSRFFSATSRKKGVSPQELKEQADRALKQDALENDQDFDAWKQTVHFPRTVQLPKTPFNEARHALALFQKDYNPQQATPEQKAQAEELEKKLGWLIFKAEALYVAHDTCFNPRFPLVETARGDVRIYSSQELAERSTAFYAQNQLYYATVQKVEQKDIKSFLRFCEEYGLTRFRLDDGLEPVTLELKHIIPETNRGFAESFASHTRGLMLRALQTLQLYKKHADEFEPQRKAALNDWFMTWNRMSVQELGKSTLFVPCALPAKLQTQLKKDHVWTPTGLKNIRTLMSTRKHMGTTISRPGFTGREALLNLPENAALPARLIKTPDEKLWIVAFTGREQAEAFVKASGRADVVVGATLDSLLLMVQKAEGCSGVLFDPGTLGMNLDLPRLEDAIKIRNEKVLIFRSEAAGTAPKKKQDDLPFELPTQPTAPAEPAEVPAPLPPE